MNIEMSELISIIDKCLTDTGAVLNGRQAVIPVKSVANSVVLASGSDPESFSEIFRMVCQRTLAKGHALAFYDLPTSPAIVRPVELPSARLH